jgi:hypothetical protein
MTQKTAVWIFTNMEAYIIVKFLAYSYVYNVMMNVMISPIWHRVLHVSVWYSCQGTSYLDKLLFGRKVLCVQQGLWYGEFVNCVWCWRSRSDQRFGGPSCSPHALFCHETPNLTYCTRTSVDLKTGTNLNKALDAVLQIGGECEPVLYHGVLKDHGEMWCISFHLLRRQASVTYNICEKTSAYNLDFFFNYLW